MKTETIVKKPKRSPYPKDIEQMRRLKPLEQLVMAKSALLLELESEMDNPDLTPRSRKLLENKIEQIQRQNLQIVQLIQTLERQLPGPKKETQRKAAPLETPAPAHFSIDPNSIQDLAPESASIQKRMWMAIGVALVFQIMTWGGQPLSQIARLFTERASSSVSASAPIVMTLDASDAFDGQSLRTESAFFKRINRELKGIDLQKTKQIEIEIHSVIPNGSTRDSSNLRYHRKLTQIRADAVVRALRRSGSFDSVEFKSSGKGADDRQGRKAILRIHSGS